jgi:hypothetical protein
VLFLKEYFPFDAQRPGAKPPGRLCKTRFSIQ